MIAIKSMENIPKSCVECVLLQHGGYCYYKNPPYELSSYDILDERPRDCPLIKIVTCKNCKYWRDSDGEYRRGVRAESKCPINSKRVYEGNCYCGYGERKD